MYEIPHYNVPKGRGLHISCGFGQPNKYLLNQHQNYQYQGGYPFGSTKLISSEMAIDTFDSARLG